MWLPFITKRQWTALVQRHAEQNSEFIELIDRVWIALDTALPHSLPADAHDALHDLGEWMIDEGLGPFEH